MVQRHCLILRWNVCLTPYCLSGAREHTLTERKRLKSSICKYKALLWQLCLNHALVATTIRVILDQLEPGILDHLAPHGFGSFIS